MTLENNEDFIDRSFNSFPNCVGNRLRAASCIYAAGRLQFFAADLQFLTWVKQKARVGVPFSGDCSRLGPPKPWARTIPEPRDFTSCFLPFLRASTSCLQRRCQSPKSFNQYYLVCFLDDK